MTEGERILKRADADADEREFKKQHENIVGREAGIAGNVIEAFGNVLQGDFQAASESMHEAIEESTAVEEEQLRELPGKLKHLKDKSEIETASVVNNISEKFTNAKISAEMASYNQDIVRQIHEEEAANAAYYARLYNKRSFYM